MVIDITKHPKLLLMMFTISLSAFFATILLVALYASGNAHAFPESFAVDNQQRLYLLFGSGGYIVTDEQFERILPSNDEHKMLWISDENLLSYARSNHITVYDLNQSDPEHGDLLEIDDFRTSDTAFYELSYGFGMTDEQNGVEYTYSRSFLHYTITQKVNGEESGFFEMPKKDFIWNLIANLCKLLVSVGLIMFLFKFWRLYHTELVKRADAKLAGHGSDRQALK
jgi:hypothetical protein